MPHSANQNIAGKTSSRSSTLELLRIIAMVMIVAHHFALHSGFQFDPSDYSLSRFWLRMLLMGGKIGVNVFVLISGYFLIENTQRIFNLNKCVKLWREILFYALIIFGIFAGLKLAPIDSEMVKYSILPITFSSWWFASCYFVLYLLHPFINKFLHSLSKKEYQILLLLAFLCWSVIPTFTHSMFEGNNLVWFIFVYCTAGYLRLYGLNPKFKGTRLFIYFLISASLTYASSIAFLVAGSFFPQTGWHDRAFLGQEKVLVYITSVLLFLIFTQMKTWQSKWINIIASSTFGVYLIHDHFLIRDFLWEQTLNSSAYLQPLSFIPYSVLVVLCVFTCCCIIDLIRIFSVEKFFQWTDQKILPGLEKRLAALSSYIQKRVF